jgi:UDP-N-acetylglucosamine 2-epimerase (non-hydrolysing)
VPEEVNRRVIDHSSSVLMPYTANSRNNLLAEGFPPNRIYVTGNPIKEVIDHYEQQIDTSRALDELGLKKQAYFLVTMHRAENVDIEDRLQNLVEALSRLNQTWGHPVICSVHPRTRSKMTQFGIQPSEEGVRFLEPFGFFDFIQLERNAFCLLSDSGTVQEEACIFGVPNVTIRDVTERPETVECGSNILSGADVDMILTNVAFAVNKRRIWEPPREYMMDGVADTVGRILLSYRIPDLAEQGWQG